MFPDRNALVLAASFLVLPVVLFAETAPGDIRATIRALPQEEKDRLRANLVRFHAMDARERDRLERLHNSIESHPRRGELMKVLEQYHNWVRTLRPGEQEELRSLPPPQRVARVKEWYWRDRLSGVKPLVDEDWGKLEKWLASNRDRAERKPPDRDPDREHRDAESRRREGRFDGTNGPPPRRGPRGGRGFPFWEMFQEVMEEEFERLAATLSPEPARLLRDQPDRRAKSQLIAHWIFARFRGNEPSRVDLEKFFATELEHTERERLLRLPRSEMEDQLRLIYGARYGRRGSGEGGPPGRGRPFGPPPPPPGGAPE